MYQVKEFYRDIGEVDKACNNWLKAEGESIEVIDIKYSVVMKPETKTHIAKAISTILVVYKTK